METAALAGKPSKKTAEELTRKQTGAIPFLHQLKPDSEQFKKTFGRSAKRLTTIADWHDHLSVGRSPSTQLNPLQKQELERWVLNDQSEIAANVVVLSQAVKLLEAIRTGMPN